MSSVTDSRPRRESTPGPALRDVQMHLHGPGAPGLGVVVSNELCTAGRRAAGFVRHVVIDVSKTKLAGAFTAGQSFGVLPPGQDARGKPHALRLYSIASPTAGEDGRGQHLATTVKRLIDEHHETRKLFLGVASNFLCDLKPGEEVRVTGPAGKRFVLPQQPQDHDFVFFATGTGIAPFRGMIRDLLVGQRPDGSRVAPCPSRVVLVMGSPYATDLLYDSELRELAAHHRNFTYLTAISRELQADGSGPMYVQDRLTSHREELGTLLASPRGLVYVCGIAGMELGIFQGLARVLPPTALEQYLELDPALPDVGGWERRMVSKEIRPTRRVFLEVY